MALSSAAIRIRGSSSANPCGNACVYSVDTRASRPSVTRSSAQPCGTRTSHRPAGDRAYKQRAIRDVRRVGRVTAPCINGASGRLARGGMRWPSVHARAVMESRNLIHRAARPRGRGGRRRIQRPFPGDSSILMPGWRAVLHPQTAQRPWHEALASTLSRARNNRAKFFGKTLASPHRGRTVAGSSLTARRAATRSGSKKESSLEKAIDRRSLRVLSKTFLPEKAGRRKRKAVRIEESSLEKILTADSERILVEIFPR